MMKFNEILDKSKKALMYDGPVFGVGGLEYLYKKSQEVDDTMPTIDGESTVEDAEFVSEETGE